MVPKRRRNLGPLQFRGKKCGLARFARRSARKTWLQRMKCRLWVREDCARVTPKTKPYQCFDYKSKNESCTLQATRLSAVVFVSKPHTLYFRVMHPNLYPEYCIHNLNWIFCFFVPETEQCWFMIRITIPNILLWSIFTVVSTFFIVVSVFHVYYLHINL
jgi:hypothetical protein